VRQVFRQGVITAFCVSLIWVLEMWVLEASPSLRASTANRVPADWAFSDRSDVMRFMALCETTSLSLQQPFGSSSTHQSLTTQTVDGRSVGASKVSQGTRAASQKRYQAGFDAAFRLGSQDGQNFRRYGAGYYPRPGRAPQSPLDRPYQAGYQAGYYAGFQVGYYGQTEAGIARQFYRGKSEGYRRGYASGQRDRQQSQSYQPQPNPPRGISREYEAGYQVGYYEGFNEGYENR